MRILHLNQSGESGKSDETGDSGDFIYHFLGGSTSVTYKAREIPKQPFKCQIVTKCESVIKCPSVGL